MSYKIDFKRKKHIISVPTLGYSFYFWSSC